jgi:hypothetical protein
VDGKEAGMKNWHKRTVFLLLVCFLLFSLSAYAAEERKSFFRSWWERVTARFRRQEPKVEEKEQIKPLSKPVTQEEEVVVEEEAITEEEAPAAKKEETPKPRRRPRKKGELPTKEEMVDTIKRRLQVFKEVVDLIPGLSRRQVKGEDAVEYYYTPSSGVTLRLEQLDRDTLYKLYVKVNQEATRMHTERLLKQIRQQEQLMRLQNLQRMQQGPPKPPAEPPKPPQVYTPPKGPPALPPKPPAERRY